MLRWLRRRQGARRLAQADAEALIRDHGASAYREARERERDVILTDGSTLTMQFRIQFLDGSAQVIGNCMPTRGTPRVRSSLYAI
jgi:hypothetical protein